MTPLDQGRQAIRELRHQAHRRRPPATQHERATHTDAAVAHLDAVFHRTINT